MNCLVLLVKTHLIQIFTGKIKDTIISITFSIMTKLLFLSTSQKKQASKQVRENDYFLLFKGEGKILFVLTKNNYSYNKGCLIDKKNILMANCLIF